MAKAKYAFQGYDAANMARAIGRDVDVSPKQAIEICNRLRYHQVSRAKRILQDAIELKRPIQFTRFTNGLGHKPGNMAAGRYCVKAAQTILTLIENAEVNAQTKGLNTSTLSIIHLCTHRANEPFRYGRQSRRQMKRAHIEIVVAEKLPENKQKTKRADKKKEAKQGAEKKTTTENKKTQ
jgi:large subunit ribosomal protein L22